MQLNVGTAVRQQFATCSSTPKQFTVLLHEHCNKSLVPHKSYFCVLRRPREQSAANAKNVFVVAPATRLPDFSHWVSEVNRRNQLRALLVSADIEPGATSQMLDRAGLRITRNVLVYTDDAVPKRLLTAWVNKAENELIATASASEDRLFVFSCAVQRYEVAFDEMSALKFIPKAERRNFVIDEDGSYIHWPTPDIHIDLDAIRLATDPEAREEALAEKVLYNRCYGAAIAKLRQEKEIKQTEVNGLSERQVRRIENGEGTTSDALRKLAAAHGMAFDEYLNEVVKHL